VCKALEGGGTNLTFRRNFEEHDFLEWEELVDCLSHIQLNDNIDLVHWCLTKNRQFTIASMYQHCSFPGVRREDGRNVEDKNSLES
jgi:hypothetical protein